MYHFNNVRVRVVSPRHAVGFGDTLRGCHGASVAGRDAAMILQKAAVNLTRHHPLTLLTDIAKLMLLPFPSRGRLAQGVMAVNRDRMRLHAEVVALRNCRPHRPTRDHG